ncbi:Putative_chromosome segregation protein SMC [Hexamita inflata]|uniref:Chromosome segregation protein SMC n=1 Tax=Hexamita inflata TaxID=28002 RepID=A0AA86R877_9EUKA|nr:Putative chromosome segregation protein SMC [Hexamita inflata]
MISSITISHFKSFVNFTVPIKKLHSAILGPNSAGKSNLLDAICFALGLDDTTRNGQLNNRNEAGETFVQIHSKKKVFKRQQQVSTSVYFINGALVQRQEYLDAIAAEFGHGIQRIAQQDTGFNADFVKLCESLCQEKDTIEQYDLAHMRLKESQQQQKQLQSKVNLQKKKLQAYELDEAQNNEFTLAEQELQQAQKDKCNHQIQKNLTDLQTAAQSLESTNQFLADLKQNHSTVIQEQELLNTNLQNLELQNQELQIELKSQKNKLELELQMKKLQLGSQKIMNEKKINNANDNLQQVLQEIQKQKVEAEKIQTEIEIYQSQKSQVRIPEEYFTLQKKFEAENQELSKEYLMQKQQVHNSKQLFKASEEKLAQCQAEDEQLKKQFNTQEEKVKQTEILIEQKQEKINQITQEISSIKDQINKNQQKSNNILIQLQPIQSKIDSSAEAQRFIKEERRYIDIFQKIRGQGIYGYVKDLYQTQYSQVADFILSSVNYNVVTSDFDVVQNLLTILKQIKVQLQFIPLKSLKFNQTDYNNSMQEMRSICSQFNQTNQGRAQPFMDILKFDPKFQPVFSHFLKNMFFFEGLPQQASHFSQQYKVRVVTEDCLLFGGKGTISVQINSKSNEKQHKEGDVLKLAQEKVQLESKLMQLNEENLALGTKLQLLINQKLSTEQIELSKLQNVIDIQIIELTKLRSLLAEQKKSTQYLKQELERNEAQLATQQSDLKQIKSRIILLQTDSFKTFYEQYNLTPEQVEQVINQQNNHDEKRIQELTFRLKMLQNESLQQQQEKTSNFIITIRQNQSQIDNQINILNALINELTQKISTTEAQLQKLKEEKEKLMNQIQIQNQSNGQINAELKSNTHLVNELQNKINSCQLELKQTLEFAFVNSIPLQSDKNTDNIHDKIQNFLAEPTGIDIFINKLALNLNYSDDYEEKITELSKKLLNRPPNQVGQAIINKEKEKMNQMEAELKTIKQTTAAQNAHYTKLLKLRGETLNEFLENVETKLKTYYEQVTSNQGQIFIQINDAVRPFQQDAVNLMLMPAGDQVRDISQVSGGEKALVRICYYLALAEVLDWKILILDEIDQNLDADKVGHVKELLMHAKQQILVVTHNTHLASGFEQLIGVSRKEEQPSQIWWIVNDTVE